MPWRCRHPDRVSCRGPRIAWAVRPQVPARRLDSSGFTSPFLLEQFLVVQAVVNGLQDGLHRKPIFFGNFWRAEGFWPDGFAEKNFCPDSTVYEQLAVVRSRLRLQVLVFDSFGHGLSL